MSKPHPEKVLHETGVVRLSVEVDAVVSASTNGVGLASLPLMAPHQARSLAALLRAAADDVDKLRDWKRDLEREERAGR